MGSASTKYKKPMMGAAEDAPLSVRDWNDRGSLVLRGSHAAVMSGVPCQALRLGQYLCLNTRERNETATKPHRDFRV